MKDLRMAELQFEAPLASFEGDEWNEFHDFQTNADIQNMNEVTNLKNLTLKSNTDVDNADNFSESFSGSLEDLVNSFDEKITKCFKNFDESTEKYAPVQVRSQEEIMNDCQMWWTITGNFGNILPIDWSKSYTRELTTKALNLGEKREHVESPDLDLSDDEELAQAFDMHRLIISSLQQEPLFTADQVINEIEDMMEDSTDDGATDCDLMSPMSTEYVGLRAKDGSTPVNFEEKHPGLKHLSSSALNELYEELESTIKSYSETLINELALRDELEYEKELKNRFITLLHAVQKKRRDCQLDRRKGMKRAKTTPDVAKEAGTYLTTVIPYHAGQGVPSSDKLQIFIKILEAINEDSSSTPGLLTDYILKVLCPTS